MSHHPVGHPVIVALDVDDPFPWLQRLQGACGAVKIGAQPFTRWGTTLVEKAQALGHRVFLDLKYHDIPNTVSSAVHAAAELGVWMLTVHACGGETMLRAARKAADAAPKGRQPLVMAVTVLTSDEAPQTLIVERAQLAQQSGCHGVICSPQEIQAVRKACGQDFMIVTPGVRLPTAAAPQVANDDQKRTASPQEALSWGADYLVMGRPILSAAAPVDVLRHIKR